MSDAYRPGQCNIGRAGRRLRARLAALGYVATALVAGAVAYLALPPAAMLVTTLPLFGATVSHLQVRRGFCSGFALAGLYDVSEAGDDRHEVTDEDARAADLAAARRLYRDAAALALSGGALLTLGWWVVA